MNEREENKAISIADLMGKNLRPAPNSDEALIRTIAEFALQLNPLQQFVLNRLNTEIGANISVPEDERNKIKIFIPDYERSKRYHDSAFQINEALGAISLKKWLEVGNIKGQVNKNTMI